MFRKYKEYFRQDFMYRPIQLSISKWLVRSSSRRQSLIKSKEQLYRNRMTDFSTLMTKDILEEIIEK